MDTKQSLLRQLPAISTILQHERIKSLEASHPHLIVAEAASDVVQGIREIIMLKGEQAETEEIGLERVIEMVVRKVGEKTRPNLKRVINATGIVLHTNLGRAVLARPAVQAIIDVAGSYSNLELDLDTGEREIGRAHV